MWNASRGPQQSSSGKSSAAARQELSSHEPLLPFAGGDLSRRWIGWADGAVTSGADAAKLALMYLDGRVAAVPRG